MAHDFKKIDEHFWQSAPSNFASDSNYWSFETVRTDKEIGAIVSVNIGNSQRFAVTSSSRVRVYDYDNLQLESTLSRFPSAAYSACFRKDQSDLLAAGAADGIIRLFMVGSKIPLRELKGHTGLVKSVGFSVSGLNIFSGGDDKSVRFWDVATGSEISTYSPFSDYVRCGVSSAQNQGLLLMGSYDHTVRLFDCRASADETCVTINHGAPVEDVLLFPSDAVAVSAGGPIVKIWDLAAGGKLVSQCCSHIKAVTSLRLAAGGRRLLSASLDRFVKIHDVSTYETVHSLSYSAPILSLDISRDDDLLLVGMADGLLSINRRNPDKNWSKKRLRTIPESKIHPRNFEPSPGDHVISHQKQLRLTPYEKFLKKFEYSKALECALKISFRRKKPGIAVSFLRELIRRRGLTQVIVGRTHQQLMTLLKFVSKNITNAAYTRCLLQVVDPLLDECVPLMATSPQIAEQIRYLREIVRNQILYIKDLETTAGMISVLKANCTPTLTNTNM